MFVPEDHFTNPKNAKSNDRFTHFAVAAARLAMKDAKLGDTPETLVNAERCGVFVGSAFGGMETFENEVLKLHKKPDRPKVRVDAVCVVADCCMFLDYLIRKGCDCRIEEAIPMFVETLSTILVGIYL